MRRLSFLESFLLLLSSFDFCIADFNSLFFFLFLSVCFLFVPLLMSLGRGYSFFKLLTFITFNSWVMVSGIVVVVLAMVIKVVGCYTEWYKQLLLKCSEVSQWMQSFFLWYCLIVSFKTQLVYNCFWVLALTAATLVGFHSIWSEDWEVMTVTAECWVFYVIS